MKFSGADRNENPLVPLVHPMGDHPNHYFLAISLAAHASDGPFYQRGQEGWFWYRVIPEPEQPDELIEPETGVVESRSSELKDLQCRHGSESICNRSWTRQLMSRRMRTSGLSVSSAS